MPTADRALMEIRNKPAVMSLLKSLETVVNKGVATGYYTKCLTYVYRFVLKNFQSQGQQVGGWKPLADSTMAWKEARGYQMILQNVGNLKNNWKPMVSPKEGILRSATNYGIYHDSDQPRKQKRGGGDRLPRRRILPTNTEMATPFKKILDFEMNQAVGRLLH